MAADEIILHGAANPYSREARQYSIPFLQGMVNRMLTSYHKYGPIREAHDLGIDFITNLKARLDKYEETGNTEWLIDVANYAMIEYMHPHHPDAHFRATESKESPGRWTTDGKWQGSKHNIDID